MSPVIIIVPTPLLLGVSSLLLLFCLLLLRVFVRSKLHTPCCVCRARKAYLVGYETMDGQLIEEHFCRACLGALYGGATQEEQSF